MLGSLTVTLNNSTYTGNVLNNYCANAYTPTASVTSVTGGSGNYSYAWTVDDPGVNIVSPSSSSTVFTAFVCCPACGTQSYTSTATMTVTDNNTGQTGTATALVILANSKSSNCVCA